MRLWSLPVIKCRRITGTAFPLISGFVILIEAIKLTMVWQTSSLRNPNFNLGCTRLEEQIYMQKAKYLFQPPITSYIVHSSS